MLHELVANPKFQTYRYYDDWFSHCSGFVTGRPNDRRVSGKRSLHTHFRWGYGPSEAPYTHQLVVPLRMDDFACAGSTKIGAILGANIDYRFWVSGNDLFPAEDSPMFVK